MKIQINSANKLSITLVAIALSANFVLPSVSFAEDDMMGSMPDQQQNSMQSDSPNTSDSNDKDHDHDQMKKDHVQMMKDHKKMMKHGSKDTGKDSSKKMNKSKKKMNSSGSGMMDDQMGSGNSGGMGDM